MICIIFAALAAVGAVYIVACAIAKAHEIDAEERVSADQNQGRV